MPDKSLGRVWSFRDVTNQKHAEEEVNHETNNFQNLNAEKDKFFQLLHTI